MAEARSVICRHENQDVLTAAYPELSAMFFELTSPVANDADPSDWTRRTCMDGGQGNNV